MALSAASMALSTVKSLRAGGGDRDLHPFTRRFGSRAEGLEDGITTGGMKASDVEHRPDDRTAAADGSPARPFVTVLGDGRKADEGCDAWTIARIRLSA